MARLLAYAEALAETTTTSGTYASKVGITASLVSGKRYLLLASGALKNSSASGGNQYRIYDTTGAAELAVVGSNHAESTTYVVQSIAAVYTAGATASRTFDIEWHRPGIVGTARFKDVRFLLLELDAADQVVTPADTSTVSTSYVDGATLTFTPATTGDYLLIAAAVLDSNTSGVKLLLSNGSTGVNECVDGLREITPASYTGGASWAAMAVENLSNSSKTIKLQYRATSGTVELRNIVLLAIRVDTLHALQTSFDDVDDSGTSSTYTTTQSLVATSLNTAARETIVLGAYTFTNGSTATQALARLTDDGVDMGQSSFEAASSANDIASALVAYHKVTGSGSVTFTVDRRSASTGQTTTVNYVGLAVLELPGAGGGTTYDGQATLPGVGALAAAPTPLRPSSAALAGAGSLAAIGNIPYLTDAALPGIGSLAARGDGFYSAAAALGGVGSISATARLAAGTTVVLPGIGSLVGIGSLRAAADISLPGVGGMVTLGERLLPSAALLAGAGEIFAYANYSARATATFQGVGSMVAIVAALAAGQSSSAGSGGLTVTGGVTAAGQAALPGDSTFSATPQVTMAAQGNLPAVGGMVVDAGAIRPSSAALSGAGGVEARANIIATAQAALQGDGTLDAVVTPLPGGNFSLFGEGHLYALGSVTVSISAALTGQGVLTVDSAVLRAASVVMTGAGAFSAAGEAIRSALSTLAGTGGFVAAGSLLADARAALAGAGGMSVLAEVVPAGEVIILPGTGGMIVDAGLVASAEALLAGRGSMFVEAEGGNVEPSLGQILAAWSIRQGWIENPSDPVVEMRVPIKAVAETKPTEVRAVPRMKRRGRVLVVEQRIERVSISARLSTKGATCWAIGNGAISAFGKGLSDGALAKSAPGGAVVVFGKAVTAAAEARGTMGGKALIRGTTRADDDALATALIALIAA